MVQEQINKIERETINNDKIQKAVIDFMEQQSKVPTIESTNNRKYQLLNNKQIVIVTTAPIKMTRSTNQIHHQDSEKKNK